ncbi:MAG: branched-chain-amino-acid transaminase [Candidatus Omnitrophica bacterium]|nr:branched-chain-amino-acid transaminase [Candidatus Omnitrophota bacterium]MBU1128422.1 branched-chain-amino-acid transaminase [Candidatus Omnitrophota bacterium]
MGLTIFLDGEFVDKEHAKVSVFDHGLLYGDGIFEGIRAYGRKVFRLDAHLDRLYAGLKKIRLSPPMAKEDLKKKILETLKRNDLDDAYIRVVVTRGVGDLGLDPRKCGKPTVFIIADKIALYPREFYTKGLPIVIAKTRRNHPSSMPPEVKSLNYLNSIFGKMDAIDAGTDEAIMLTTDGYVAECTGDNIFIARNGKLSTPPYEIGSLDGITQNVVIQLAGEAGIKIKRDMLTPDDLYAADECFLTGTAAEVIPVISVNGTLIAGGIPGKITIAMMNAFSELTGIEGVKY